MAVKTKNKTKATSAQRRPHHKHKAQVRTSLRKAFEPGLATVTTLHVVVNSKDSRYVLHIPKESGERATLIMKSCLEAIKGVIYTF